LTPLQFGLLTPGRIPYDGLAQYARDAEAMGFDSVWVDDDIFSPTYSDFDPWTLLAGLAVETERIRLGTLVSVITFRYPSVLAAQAITADHLSKGRIELGLGAGAPGLNGAVGLAEWTPRERSERLEEYVAILAPMLRGERVDFDGAHYTVHDAQVAAPIQKPRPPLKLAAHGDRGLRVVARYADGWNTLVELTDSAGGDASWPAILAGAVAMTKQRSERLDTIALEEGRDPATLRRSVIVYRATVDPFSSVEAFDEVAGAFQNIGIGEIIFLWPPLENLMPGGDAVPGPLRRPPDIPLTAAQHRAFERVVAERISIR
jgi:alkanesulfonate monooxygenase SsuD/methylene tetrahydromethanopterin reductase-like flavin-dependent oxidoreductase (luciferase family)